MRQSNRTTSLSTTDFYQTSLHNTFSFQNHEWRRHFESIMNCCKMSLNSPQLRLEWRQFSNIKYWRMIKIHTENVEYMMRNSNVHWKKFDNPWLSKFLPYKDLPNSMVSILPEPLICQTFSIAWKYIIVEKIKV